MKQEEINDRSRRDFLKTAAVATVAATACGSLACSCGGKKHEHAASGEKVKLLSSAGTGHFYVATKNKRLHPDKMNVKKYDPVVRKHVDYKETKIK